jgi:hypothetical protein
MSTKKAVQNQSTTHTPRTPKKPKKGNHGLFILNRLRKQIAWHYAHEIAKDNNMIKVGDTVTVGTPPHKDGKVIKIITTQHLYRVKLTEGEKQTYAAQYVHKSRLGPSEILSNNFNCDEKCKKYNQRCKIARLLNTDITKVLIQKAIPSDKTREQCEKIISRHWYIKPALSFFKKKVLTFYFKIVSAIVLSLVCQIQKKNGLDNNMSDSYAQFATNVQTVIQDDFLLEIIEFVVSNEIRMTKKLTATFSSLFAKKEQA